MVGYKKKNLHFGWFEFCIWLIHNKDLNEYNKYYTKWNKLIAFKVNKKDMKFKCHKQVFVNKSFET